VVFRRLQATSALRDAEPIRINRGVCHGSTVASGNPFVCVAGLSRGVCVLAPEEPAEEPGHRRGDQEVRSDEAGDPIRLVVQRPPVQRRVLVFAVRRPRIGPGGPDSGGWLHAAHCTTCPASSTRIANARNVSACLNSRVLRATTRSLIRMSDSRSSSSAGPGRSSRPAGFAGLFGRAEVPGLLGLNCLSRQRKVATLSGGVLSTSAKQVGSLFFDRSAHPPG
jgi:hypothetical protein